MKVKDQTDFLKVLFSGLGSRKETIVNEFLGRMSSTYENSDGMAFFNEFGISTGEAQIAVRNLLKKYI